MRKQAFELWQPVLLAQGYIAKRIDEVWSNAVNAGKPINTNTHDATVGLNPDGSSMIVYHTSTSLVSGDLYETRFHAGNWQDPLVMTERINSKEHEPSASIAPGGDEIYFTSDRPGGFGGRDLYRIRRLPNDEWSLPLNLGPKVNTAFDEDAPFMHSDGITLFFSSRGHNTMGGYDIFKTTLLDADMNGWGIPENMGYPLNTVNDDRTTYPDIFLVIEGVRATDAYLIPDLKKMGIDIYQKSPYGDPELIAAHTAAGLELLH